MRMFFRSKKPVREIFDFHDGIRARRADPLLIFRKMAQHPTFDLEKNNAERLAPDVNIQIQASGVAVDAMREIFDIQPWDENTGHGLTEGETLDVLNQFTLFVDGLKKNGSGQPT